MPQNVPGRWMWSFDNFGISTGEILKDKGALVTSYILYMLARTQRMFEYDGLPETIPQRNLEMLLQINGYAVFANVPEKGLYAFRAGLGGVPNAYYEPTKAIIANPGLEFNLNGKIGEDVIVVRNDSFYQGLIPLLSKYASLMADCDISMRYALLNSRLSKFLTARDDNTKDSAKKVLDDVEMGRSHALFLADDFLTEALKESNSPQRDGHIKDIIECTQYLKASQWNELGVQSQFNMKREAINSAESALNDDVLSPLVEDMLEMRKQGFQQVDKLFGTSVSVRLASSWKKTILEELAAMKNLMDIIHGKNEDPKPEPDPEPAAEEKKEDPENAN